MTSFSGLMTPLTPETDGVAVVDLSDNTHIRDDNYRVLMRMQAAIEDKTGRLRLLIDGTNADCIPGFELASLRHTLREINCSNSPRLTQLPMELGHLHETLRTLDCSGCALTSLPAEISLLHQLETLNCSNNKLTTFVWNASALKKLAHLDLSFNMMSHMSPSSAQLLFGASSRVQVNLEGNDATLRETAKLTELEQRSLLPVEVNACVVCDEVQARLPPKVFVQFARWRKPPSPFESHPTPSPLVLVPVLYPCCGSECAKALQQWQGHTAGRW